MNPSFSCLSLAMTQWERSQHRHPWSFLSSIILTRYEACFWGRKSAGAVHFGIRLQLIPSKLPKLEVVIGFEDHTSRWCMRTMHGRLESWCALDWRDEVVSRATVSDVSARMFTWLVLERSIARFAIDLRLRTWRGLMLLERSYLYDKPVLFKRPTVFVARAQGLMKWVIVLKVMTF